MGKSATKVVYKPDPNASDVFLVIVNPVEFKKWKDGDRMIPLVDVVDSFEILSSNQGPQGLLRRPSKQELDNEFGTHVDVDVVQQILEKGKEEGRRKSRIWQVGKQERFEGQCVFGQSGRQQDDWDLREGKLMTRLKCEGRSANCT